VNTPISAAMEPEHSARNRNPGAFDFLGKGFGE